VASGGAARRLYGDLTELHALRLKRAGGSVYKRPGSRFWQIQYLVNGKWRQETAHTEKKRDAEALLREKVFHASAGTLPGTSTFEQVIDAVVDDARVRGNKAAARIAGAARALKARLEGYRAEACDYSVWLKYAKERQQEASADTVHFELTIAKRAFKLARVNGIVSRVPDFPPIRNLRVRQRFVDPAQWMQVRAKLQADLRDAADFAYICGPREMEILALKWSDVERDAGVLHFRETKTGKPRVAPYGKLPDLVAVIERREAVAEQLKRAAGVITPWVFCFAAPVMVRGRQYHAAGAQLFKATGQRGLLNMLRDEWDEACKDVGLPGLLFHDLRRSAARNFERAGIPRSIAMKLGGWSDKMYSRYSIGAESEIGPEMPKLGEYLNRAGLHFGDTAVKTPVKSKEKMAEGGRSRTFRQAYCPPGRF